VITIGKEAHLLIHEATGPEKGHSSAAQAAETAMQANAKELLLIHYPTGKYQQKDIIDEARQVFTGKISRAVDMQTIQID
jgi:ribonuclease Z